MCIVKRYISKSNYAILKLNDEINLKYESVIILHKMMWLIGTDTEIYSNNNEKKEAKHKNVYIYSQAIPYM